MVASTRIIGLRPVSIAVALTTTNLTLGTPQARGLIIPVSAAPAGSCLSFWFRNYGSFDQNGGNVILDARDVLQGTLFSYGDAGPVAGRSAGRSYIDGYDVGGYSTNVILANTARSKWQRFDLVFRDVPRQAGYLYFYLDRDGHNSYQPLVFADVRSYAYAPSPAQLAQPLLPDDYELRYSFADYQPGDTQATDSSGNGNHAVIYY